MPRAILSLKLSIPARIPILYVILGVLVAISVVPMYFYSAKVESINRDRLKTNEMLLQNTVTRSLADDLSQHEASLHMMLANLSSAVQISSGGDIEGDGIETFELRALLENFVSSSDDIAYATLLNTQAKGISAGRIVPDAFVRRELERGFAAAREGRAYNGQALVVDSGKSARTVVLVSGPVMDGGHNFLGMIGAEVDLQFLIRRMQEVSRTGLTPYVVDAQGRLVAASRSRLRHRPGHEEPGNRLATLWTKAARPNSPPPKNSSCAMATSASKCWGRTVRSRLWTGQWWCRSRGWRRIAAFSRCSTRRVCSLCWRSWQASL